MRGAEFRPRPIGLANLAPDGGGGSSGKRHLRLLPGATPLGEPIGRSRPGEQRQTEPVKPTLREEINAYLAERVRLRAEGQLPTLEDKPPIITPADAISVDLDTFLLSQAIPKTDEERVRYGRVRRIKWGFDTSAFGSMSQGIQKDVTEDYEATQWFNHNRPHVLEGIGRLDNEETAIFAEQLQKIGLPKPRPGAITIPFVPMVQAMRTIIGGEPLLSHIPHSNVTNINDHPRRDH